jgi:hypothetical protein
MGGRVESRRLLSAGYVPLLLGLVTALAGCGGGGGSSSDGLNLSGAPATQVQVGQQYSFTPTVSNAGAASIGFSISNKPAWATFNTTSGQLTGTPTSSDIGTDANVAISASSSASSTSLPPFTIKVVQAGRVVLNWQAPTTNSDGSPLTNLAGYTIKYGSSSSELTGSVTIDSPTVTSYTFPNLGPGTWYFAISADNSAGTRGAISKVVGTTLR